MSHFTVAVFTDGTKSLEELLAPYQENNMGDCPKEYLAFHDEEDSYLKEYEEDGLEMIKTPNEELIYTWDNSLRKIQDSFRTKDLRVDKNEYIKKLNEMGYKEVFVKYKEKYPTFEEFVRDFHGREERDPETKRYGYWENPNRKWDWYQLGGRWQGSLLVKDDSEHSVGSLGLMTQPRELYNPAPEGYKWVDQAKVGDIEWDLMAELNKKEAINRWEEAEKDPKQDTNYRYFMYGIKKDMTKEDYISSIADNFETYAVLTTDGKWHEKGKMGWFGISTDEKQGWSESYKESFIKNADPNWTISIVDCHI